MAGRRSLPLLAALLFAAASLDAAASADADVLLQFKASITGSGNAFQTWAPGTAPCKAGTANWAGVLCDNDGGVRGLQLENMGLSGELNFSVLKGLPALRTLSFMNNSFEGGMPDIRALPLRSIFLSRNKLSGVIPSDAFAGMLLMKKVYLSHNGFSGPIPASLTRLPMLLELRLDDNKFTGPIPDLQQKGLTLLNVADNDLEGPIPTSLSKMGADGFAGNKALCGGPLKAPCPATAQSSPTETPPPPAPAPASGAHSTVVVPVIITACILVAAVGLVLFTIHRRGQDDVATLGRPSPAGSAQFGTYREEEKLEQGEAEGGGSTKKAAAAKEPEQGRLMFVMQGRERFELPELLKSSAEVLGNGNFGCSYKATLPTGASMVVKRYKDMNRVGKEDFEEHMRRLGRLSHTNLLPLVAYYYRKEEKLLVTDFIANRSLSLLLHGNPGPNSPQLNWPARLQIIKGIAAGLSYLYDELRVLTVPHGHLKSSNVLLGDSLVPLLADYALTPVMNQSHAAQFMMACQAPERKQFGKATKKSDVWCFGTLTLEILTGQAPIHDAPPGKRGVDLASWVGSAVEEGRAHEVFDRGMSAPKQAEGEMMKLLRIALACCEADVDKRWELEEVLDKIDELKEVGDGGSDCSSSSDGDGDGDGEGERKKHSPSPSKSMSDEEDQVL